MNPQITQDNCPDQTFELVIPAGESRRVDGIANRFYFVYSNGPIRVKTGIIPERYYSKAQGKLLPSPAVFKYAELHNDNDYAVRLELEWTFGDFIDRRFIVAGDEGAALATFDNDAHIEAQADLADSNLAHDGKVEFDPDPPAGYLKRRYVSISNNSATARLKLLDADDNEIGSVPPAQTLEFYHQDFFKLLNDSGSGVDVKAYTAWEQNPYLL